MAELIFQVAAKAPSYNYKSDLVTLWLKTDRWLLLVLKILAPSHDPRDPEDSAMPIPYPHSSLTTLCPWVHSAASQQTWKVRVQTRKPRCTEGLGQGMVRSYHPWLLPLCLLTLTSLVL